MRTIITTLTVLTLLMTSCQGRRQTSEEVTEPSSATERIALKQAAMLSVSDKETNFLFNEDKDIEAADPNAYWLMNKMMQSMIHVKTAEDGLAWALAFNENVKEYSKRLRKNINKEDAEEAATLSIAHLMNLYYEGSMAEINTATYVNSILAIYKTTNKYISLMSRQYDESLTELIYREYCEWFDMNNAANAILYSYTFGNACYSSAPMDLNETFESWSANRLKELNAEEDILCWGICEPYPSYNAGKVSYNKFAKLVKDSKASLVSRRKKESIETYEYDFLLPMFDEYSTALEKWYKVREEIASHLEDDSQKAYRKMTATVASRLYEEFSNLMIMP